MSRLLRKIVVADNTYRHSHMRRVIITESSLRGLLREMMDSSSGGPVNVNPVIDPQAAEVDPSNPNFIPTNKIELMSALRALVDPVEDDQVPQVYVAIKDAIGEEEAEEKEDIEMKDSKFAEAIIRQTVRNILKESFLSEETAAEKRARIARTVSAPQMKSVSPSDVAASKAKEFVSGGGEIKKLPGAPSGEKPVKPIDPSKSEAQEEIESLQSQLEPVMSIVNGIPSSYFDAFNEAFEAVKFENPSASPDEVVDSKEFSSTFKKATGTTFKQFLNEMGESLMGALGNLTGEFTTKEIADALAAEGLEVSASMLENKVYQSALAKAVFLKKAQEVGAAPEGKEGLGGPSVSDFAKWMYGSIDLDEEGDISDNEVKYMLAVIKKPEFQGPARRDDIIKAGFDSAGDNDVWAEFMEWWKNNEK